MEGGSVDPDFVRLTRLGKRIDLYYRVLLRASQSELLVGCDSMETSAGDRVLCQTDDSLVIDIPREGIPRL